MASTTRTVLCPGCGHPFRASTGLMNHLTQTRNAACQQAYNEILKISLDSSSSSLSDSDSQSSDIHAADYAENTDDIVSSDAGSENFPDNSDFSGLPSGLPEPEDIDMDIQFEVNLDDIALDLGPLPELEEDSDDEDEEYIW